MPSIEYSLRTSFDSSSSNSLILDPEVYDSNESEYVIILNTSFPNEDQIELTIINNTTEKFQRFFLETATKSFLIDFTDNIGNVNIAGFNFNDILRSGSGLDTIGGSAGDDVLEGGASQDYLDGQSGNDTLRGGGGADTLFGMNGNDRLVITETPTQVDGGADTDTLFVLGTSSSTVVLTDGNFVDIEKVYVRDGTLLDMGGVGGDQDATGSVIFSQSTTNSSAQIYGTQDADTITAGKGNDVIFGGEGSDRITTGAGINLVRGGSGNDTINMSAGRGRAEGGDGNDVITGSKVSQSGLFGDVGGDRITASAGGAIIDGGEGADKLFAADGRDNFFFNAEFGRDNIYRFNVENDRFDVSRLVDSFDDVNISPLNGGTNTLITLDGAGSGNKIILQGVDADSLTATHFRFAEPVQEAGLLLS